MEAKEEAGATPHRPGNFANDRERASEAGRKGGQGAAEERRSSRDDETSSEADRKGGQR